MPEAAKKYFDYKAYGRDAVAEDKGTFTDYGYIYNNKNEFAVWYERGDVPQEYRLTPDPQIMEDRPLADMPAPSVPVRPIELSATDTAGRVREITAQLEQGVKDLFESERYQEYLKAMSKFHDYSLNNTMLIVMQKPDASLVAGYGKWRDEFERHVKRGEKGIKILAPAPYKVKREVEKTDPDTGQPIIGSDGKPVVEEKEITIPSFKVVSVFDVSQTEGKEIPNLSADALTGDIEQYEDFFRALELTSPVPVEFENITSGAHGYYDNAEKRIAINEGESELQTVKTLIHEIAHAKLHDIDLTAALDEQNIPNRRTREVEAESVAYTVCQHFGLDTSDYSFGYITGWSSDKDIKELKTSLETIRATANDLITEIEGHFAQMQQQRETDRQQENTFSIYQLKGGDETRDLRFEPYDSLQAAGLSVDPANYDLIYTAPLTPGMTLESIWQTFNIDRPADFKGHSLSVSDIVVLHQDGRDAAHYVDSVGYTEVSEFLQPPEDGRDRQLEKQAQPEMTPDSLMTGETVKTPRGNFYVTDMSREQIEAAGYGFHHASDDGKYLIMGNGTQAFAIVAEQPQRDNPLKHVEDTVEQNDNRFYGIINNTPQTPTVAELEQKAKAGEAISIADLAKTVKNEKRETPPKKRSILKQLDEYKKQAAQQPKKQQQKGLKQDREV